MIFLFIFVMMTKGEVFRFRMPEEVPVNTLISDLPKLLNIRPVEMHPPTEYRFQLVSSAPIYHQLFSIEPRTGILRTASSIDRDQLCQRAELCCQMSPSHEITDLYGISMVGMEAVQNKMRNQFSQRRHQLATGLTCLLEFRVAFNQQPDSLSNSGTDRSATGSTSFAYISIELMDINDNVPQFVGLSSGQTMRNYDGQLMYIMQISEAADIGKQLSLPLAQDADAGSFGVQSYRLEEPSSQVKSSQSLDMRSNTNKNSFPFVLISTHRDDGVVLPKLELREQLNYETQKSFYTSLVAYDGDHSSANSAELLIRVDVIDENDNQPVITVRRNFHNLDSSEMDPTVSDSGGHLMVQVREDCSVGTLLAQFEAHDADSEENGRITFSWSETTPPKVQKLFELNPMSGELRLATRLDYDNVARASKSSSMSTSTGSDVYNLVVIASDEGTPVRLSASVSLSIKMIDVNDEEPRITVMDLSNRSPPHLEVWENELENVFVALVTVQDLDGATGLNGQFVCTLNTSLFKLVTADPYPNFNSQNQVSADGLLAYNELIYAGAHGLNSVSGSGSAEFKLITTTSFDREQTPVHYLTIRCRDNGVPALESQISLAVNILDKNDNPPKFAVNPLVVTIKEDASVGSLVTILNATDPDRPDDSQPVTYSLVSITALSNPISTSSSTFSKDAVIVSVPTNTTQFRLESHTGRLILTEALDRETCSEYQLTVRAVDRSLQPLTCDLALHIRIIDVNDNAPVFSQSVFRFAIEEEKTAGTVVGFVSASDPDDQDNGKISYRLFGSAAIIQRSFAVNANTGEITTKISLDREVNAVYEFFVTAEDGNQAKRLTATTKVLVEVIDINDNNPKFIYPTQPNHTIHALAYSKVGTAVVKLTVFDADASSDQGILFVLKNSTAHGLFTLNSRSGELSFAREATDDDIGNHHLEIEARDNGVPSRSSVTFITVVIDTRTNQRGTAAVSYPSPASFGFSKTAANGATSWARPRNNVDNTYLAPGDQSNYLEDSDMASYSLNPRQQESGFSVDRRLILICCLVFLGCLLLIVFGTILIRFKRKGQPFGDVPPELHQGVYRSNQRLSKDSVGAKVEKYRNATLQSPLPYTMGKDNRSVYGVHGQIWPSRIPVGYAETGLGLICPTNQMLHDPQEQHEQLLRMTNVHNMSGITPDGFENSNIIQVRSSREDTALQAKHRSNSLGDGLGEYSLPTPMSMELPTSFYLSQNHVNKTEVLSRLPHHHPHVATGAWKQQKQFEANFDNNYEATGGTEYYNKLSACSGGVILQPSAYMQGGPLFTGPPSESYPDPAFFTQPSVKVARPKCQSGYQTLGVMPTTESPIKTTSDPLVTSADEQDPFQQEHISSPVTTTTTMSVDRFDGKTSSGGCESVSSLAWKRNLGKKGIVSSSFV